MTASDGDSSRFGDKTLLGVFASFVAAFAIYGVVLLLTGNETVASVFAASAAGVPAAVEYRLQSKRRDPTLDAARLGQGELRRPIPLVLVMFVVAVFLLDTVIGAVVGGFYGVLAAFGVDVGALSLVIWLLVVVTWSALSGVVSALVSNYLGAHPYRWITLGIGIVLVLRLIVLFAIVDTGFTGLAVDPATMVSLGFGYLLCLAACLLGVRVGRRYRDRFIAMELRRAQRKRGAAPPPPTVPPRFATLPPPNPRDRRLE